MYEPNDDIFGQIEAWFDTCWENATRVDDAAIILAAKRFRPWPSPDSQSKNEASLLGLIAADPDLFSDVSIVIVGTPTTSAQRTQIRSAITEKHPEEAENIDSLPDDGIFSGWERQDLNHWRRVFIELWMPGTRLSVYGRKVVYFHDLEGAVMSKKDWLSIKQVVGHELPTATRIANTDGAMVKRLLDMHGNRLYSARELAVEIQTISLRPKLEG